MAKGYGLSGNMTGKKGNSIFYRIANSKNKVTQGVREYQPSVSNPKTTAQAEQRMKMAPALNFYRAFREVLDHSWEGVKYGGASYNRFIKEALNLKAPSAWPYLMKGYMDYVPGAYKVSSGSLTGIDVLGMSRNEAGNFIVLNTGSSVDQGNITDANVYVNEVLNAYPQLQRGDQITVVGCGGESSVEDYEAYVFRMVLDPDKIREVAGSSTNWVDAFGFTIREDGIALPYFWAQWGAAVIVSRPTESAGTITWRRSNAQIFLNMPGSAWFSQEQYEKALQSYMTGTPATESDWYLNQGELAAGENEDVEAPTAQLLVENYMSLDPNTLFEDYPGTAGRMAVARLIQTSTGNVVNVAEISDSGIAETPKKAQPYYWSEERGAFVPGSIVLLESDALVSGVTLIDRTEATARVERYGIAQVVNFN